MNMPSLRFQRYPELTFQEVRGCIKVWTGVLVLLVVVVDRQDATSLNFKCYLETTSFSKVTLKNSGFPNDRCFVKINREELSLTLPGLSTPDQRTSDFGERFYRRWKGDLGKSSLGI